MNDERIKKSIIDTISYFDIFNYPLSLSQMHFFLHYLSVDRRTLEKNIDEIKIIEKKRSYYFLKGRELNYLKKNLLASVNRKKKEIAMNYIWLLSKVPGIKMIALTGSLSMSNANENDDIDLFVITSRNMVWVARFLSVVLTKTKGIKREYRKKSTKDKVCLNMFLDESDMEIDSKNLYTAHEILQMNVYFNKDNTLEKFIEKNSWIFDYFPNIYIKGRRKKTDHILSNNKVLTLLNHILFLFQYFYMFRKIKNEKVSLTKAFFHPNNNSDFILKEHKTRTKRFYNLYEESKNGIEFEAEIRSTRKLKFYN